MVTSASDRRPTCIRLAATMHHLITGIRPTFSSRIQGWAPLDDVDPALAPVVAVVTAGLSDAAVDRPSMRDFADAFDAAAANLGPRAIKRLAIEPATGEATVRHAAASSVPPNSPPSPSSSPGPRTGSPDPARPSTRWVVPALAGLVAVAVLVGVVLAVGGDDEPPPGTAIAEPGPEVTEAVTPGAGTGEASEPGTSAPPAMSANDPGPAPVVADGVLQLSGFFPLTGDLGVLGEAARRGFELAVADVNAAGGVLDQAVAVEVVDTDASGPDSIDPDTDVVIGPLSNEMAGAHRVRRPRRRADDHHSGRHRGRSCRGTVRSPRGEQQRPGASDRQSARRARRVDGRRGRTLRFVGAVDHAGDRRQRARVGRRGDLRDGRGRCRCWPPSWSTPNPRLW